MKRLLVLVVILLVMMVSVPFVQARPNAWSYSASVYAECTTEGNSRAVLVFTNTDSRTMYIKVSALGQTQAAALDQYEVFYFRFDSGQKTIPAGTISVVMAWNQDFTGSKDSFTRSYPEWTCTQHRPDKSSLEVNGECTAYGAEFTVTNSGEPGEGDMVSPTGWRLVRVVDGTILRSGSLQIPGGESLTYRYQGSEEVRFEADQQVGHPGNSHPNAVLYCSPPPPTDVPPTSVPPTAVPPTAPPPTDVPPTVEPPTVVPPTEVPPTGVPSTITSTTVPSTNVPPTATAVYQPEAFACNVEGLSAFAGQTATVGYFENGSWRPIFDQLIEPKGTVTLFSSMNAGTYFVKVGDQIVATFSLPGCIGPNNQLVATVQPVPATGTGAPMAPINDRHPNYSAVALAGIAFLLVLFVIARLYRRA